MIQIDMPMPEKCSDCIFCDDNCSCVASDYNGLGINVGCAYRTGRRDIRCPLNEQEAVKPKVIMMNAFGYPVYACGKCGFLITESKKYCPECGKRIEWEGR